MTLKRLKKSILLASLLLFTNTSSILANDNIRFKNIGIEEGISQSTVEKIFQDSKGYMWIATNDGLNRYNGYEFKVYKYGEDETKTLSSSSIIDIQEDEDGYIWVATSNGLNKIDPKTDEIKRYMDKENGGTLSNFNITELITTKDKKFLVATTDGLNIYNEKTDTFKRVLQNKNDLTDQFIYSIEEGKNGDLWIGTNTGLDQVSSDLKPLRKYKNDTENEISKSSIYNMQYDDKRYLWLGTSESGLVKIDLTTYEIKTYINEDNDTSISDNKIKDIFKDNLGNIWIGTDNGLSKYNYEKDNFHTYKSNIEDKNSLIHNRINTINQDEEGLLWIGTYLGISIFDPDNTIKYYKADKENTNSLNFNSIHGIYEDDEGLLWVGTDSKGINIIDRKNNIINYIDEIHTQYELSNYSIKDISGNGKYIYVATKDGLNIIDKESKKTTVYKEEDGLSSNLITKLFLDSKGYLWIGNNEGLNIMNTKDNSIIDISNNIRKDSEVIHYVNSIYEDSEGIYYVGVLRNEGLIKINPKDNTVKVYKNDKNNDKSISNNYIRSIVEDLNGDIWVSTSYGLNKFDKKTEEFTRYTMKDGICNDTIYGILVDNNNNLWLSTNGGISKFNPRTNKVQNFTIVDGLQSNEFNGNAYYKTKAGDLVFGGVNGLNILNPKEVSLRKYTSNIVFEKPEINGKKVNTIDKKVLKHNQNTIKIRYFLPKYSNSKNIEYYYKLEGLDIEWSKTKNNDIVFHELKPGEYTFRIVPKFSNGEIGNEKTIKFEIAPIFWESNIAMICYLLLIIYGVYRVKNKTKTLDRLVKKKTNQLVKEMDKNTELLNKVIKLEKNKNNYFVNLSHELRTPLNVISSTNQLIKELSKSNKIDKEKLIYYMEISNKNCRRLLNLINNIIDSSKLESDNYIINMKKENIVNIVEEASLSLVEFAKTKKIDLIIDPKIEEVYVNCDDYEIERCVVNLVSNAIKFTPENGTIEVSVEEDGCNAIIIVKDDGIGIDKKYQEFIFNRFSQVIEANDEIKGGSGLGLTITKQIIELHSGDIYVDSEVNKGSKFVIVLPIDNKR